jgi:hypothetical protein
MCICLSSRESVTSASGELFISVSVCPLESPLRLHPESSLYLCLSVLSRVRYVCIRRALYICVCLSSRESVCGVSVTHPWHSPQNGKTKYLSELRAGSEVLAVSSQGTARSVVVGRVKIEKRPLVLVETVREGRYVNALPHCCFRRCSTVTVTVTVSLTVTVTMLLFPWTSS